MQELLIGIERAFETYLRFISATEVLGESWNKAFREIPGFASCVDQRPRIEIYRRGHALSGHIIRKRTGGPSIQLH